jgi:hypothetical protein
MKKFEKQNKGFKKVIYYQFRWRLGALEVATDQPLGCLQSMLEMKAKMRLIIHFT